MPLTVMTTAAVLGVRVDGFALDECLDTIVERVGSRRGGYVCACNVHMVMEAKTLPDLKRALDDAALVVADGAPLSWSLRARGVTAERVTGTELALAVIEKCVDRGWSVGLFGATDMTLRHLVASLRKAYPALNISCAVSPPFGGVDDVDASDEARAVIEAAPDVLLVGLGCPKQEVWMARQVGRSQSVMLGVGATFDFLAGNVRRAPQWMQQIGCEWVFRLVLEPRRLFGRYARHNPRFVILALREVLSSAIRQHSSPGMERRGERS